MKVTLETRIAVVTRDRFCCARCGEACEFVQASVHHRRPRGMGGTKDPRSSDLRNLVLVCGSGVTGCHGWVESHRADAYEQGWLLRSYDDLDQPLIALNGDHIHLTADGGRTDTWPTLADLKEARA